MWVHELGHATAAWLCAFPAFPGPWLTPMAESRSGAFGFLVFLAIASGAFWAWRTERRRSCIALGALLPVQLFCALALSEARAKQLIVFMGDGGCMILGTLLMLSVYAPEESALKRGWLRWGFLVIGAAAFADAFAQWWASRTDFDRIPFGMNEGAGLSDPSVLSQTYFWSTDQIVHRYVALGCVCLAVLVVSYALALLRQRKA
jgi:UDP-N-acetylmuramyl pentapeptide phosphotransferase/UDP-N-acetylglucosamine-1-phosphate transferase